MAASPSIGTPSLEKFRNCFGFGFHVATSTDSLGHKSESPCSVNVIEHTRSLLEAYFPDQRRKKDNLYSWSLQVALRGGVVFVAYG